MSLFAGNYGGQFVESVKLNYLTSADLRNHFRKCITSHREGDSSNSDKLQLLPPCQNSPALSVIK